MRGVSVTKTITLSFTADDWELYTQSFPKHELAVVAMQLNKELALLLNAGLDRGSVFVKFDKFVERYRKYGAWDSEPIRLANRVLDGWFEDPLYIETMSSK